MHVRGKVGLSIDYWKEQRDTSVGDDDEGRLWRVIVEVDATTPDYTALTGFAPVRASNHWVSDEVKKQRYMFPFAHCFTISKLTKSYQR